MYVVCGLNPFSKWFWCHVRLVRHHLLCNHFAKLQICHVPRCRIYIVLYLLAIKICFHIFSSSTISHIWMLVLYNIKVVVLLRNQLDIMKTQECHDTSQCYNWLGDLFHWHIYFSTSSTGSDMRWYKSYSREIIARSRFTRLDGRRRKTYKRSRL